MEDREMISACREFLNGQKIMSKTNPDGTSVLFKVNNETYEMAPCLQDGHAHLGRYTFLNVENMADTGRIWNAAMQKWSFDPTFDGYYAISMNLFEIPNQPAGRKKCFLWYRFDSWDDLKAIFGDPETFKEILGHIRILGEYIEKENKKV